LRSDSSCEAKKTKLPGPAGPRNIPETLYELFVSVPIETSPPNSSAKSRETMLSTPPAALVP
jgi:hypothetical protein